jgi:hypothetical protein
MSKKVEIETEEEPMRQFYHAAEAWHYHACFDSRRDGVVDDVAFSDRYIAKGEAIIEWLDFGNNHPPTARLHVYDDGWPLVLFETAMLSQIFAITDVMPDQVCAILKEHGYVDTTVRERK